MILRKHKSQPGDFDESQADFGEGRFPSDVDHVYSAPAPPEPLRSSKRKGLWSNQASLRWRITMLTAAMVAVAVGMMTIVAYWTVSATLRQSVDKSLENSAAALLQQAVQPTTLVDAQNVVDNFRLYHPETRVSIRLPGSSFVIGDDIPQLTSVEADNGEGKVATVDGERIYSKSNGFGATVVLAQDMRSHNQLITSLGLVLLLVGAIGIALAVAAGKVVASAGLRPLAHLQAAVDRVRRTNELRQIEVLGNDELADLTRSFNEMLEALETSRRRQADLVADAGHELKTPLTSMRTNIELLMMMQRSGGAGIPEEDRIALEHDVIAQMEEMSTLIGDLVDLARDDAPDSSLETVDMVEVTEAAFERVQRRRPDVTFHLETTPWYLDGDTHGLSRAIVNLLDNAAKWSPNDGVVRLCMTPLYNGHVEITVSDSGPGIPVEDREKVFERFFRSVQGRSTPGSGLGLAIVKQTIERHGGTITAEESDDGGAMMRVILPGYAMLTDLEKSRIGSTRKRNTP